MQSKIMHIDVLARRHVQLHDCFVLAPEEALDKAHLGPIRRAPLSADADVIPSPFVAEIRARVASILGKRVQHRAGFLYGMRNAPKLSP